jgi:hypothetical protein
MLIHTRPVNKTHKIDASSKNNRHVHFSVRRLTRSRQIISHPTTTACSTAPAPAVRTAGPHFLVRLSHIQRGTIKGEVGGPPLRRASFDDGMAFARANHSPISTVRTSTLEAGLFQEGWMGGRPRWRGSPRANK